jgi:protein-tyrosine phosphatase
MGYEPMVDIHSHILWGLDDGAETRDDSLAMLAMAARAGTTDIVATPHANLHYRFDEELIGERIRELSEATGDRPKIHRGCDFHLTFDNIQDAIEHPARYTVNGGPYLLVEFPDSLASMRPALDALLNRGLIPIMTHPERHPHLQEINAEFREWLGLGCLAQITGASLRGRFGKKAEAAAWDMVERGMAHFVASDAHGVEDRTARLDEAFAAVAAAAGEDCADRLFQRNPAAVIAGEPIQAAKAPRKAWYDFRR